MLSTKRYDSQRNVKFSTFAYPRVRGRIIRALGKEIKNNQARGQYNQEVFADSVERVAHVSKEFEELDKQKQEILELYANGHTHREIAKKVGLTHQRITQVLQEIEKPNLPKHP